MRGLQCLLVGGRQLESLGKHLSACCEPVQFGERITTLESAGLELRLAGARRQARRGRLLGASLLLSLSVGRWWPLLLLLLALLLRLPRGAAQWVAKLVEANEPVRVGGRLVLDVIVKRQLVEQTSRILSVDLDF